ncbi:hypothetical protein CPB85DRAFT_1491026 [Mucidula mucida]|nr:hypothetical protein CPB85DRAFT_1491026 [Mucidula mucida]
MDQLDAYKFSVDDFTLHPTNNEILDAQSERLDREFEHRGLWNMHAMADALGLHSGELLEKESSSTSIWDSVQAAMRKGAAIFDSGEEDSSSDDEEDDWSGNEVDDISETTREMDGKPMADLFSHHPVITFEVTWWEERERCGSHIASSHMDSGQKSYQIQTDHHLSPPFSFHLDHTRRHFGGVV